jgi:NAD(P)-dependent dehydrogenase (short-subunit alcohol dehydrogenase family)
MTTALQGQTVVLIGGSAGIGLATAKRTTAEGAQVVLTGRDSVRLEKAASEVGALSHTAFDAHDSARLEEFFHSLPQPVDHVMVTAGSPAYGPLSELDIKAAGRHVAEHITLTLTVARQATETVRPSGSVVFMGGTGARRPAAGISLAAAVTAAMPALTANLALEIAPVRVNLIAPGFVDTPLSASILGDALDERRDELRTTLPIGRVVQPEDIAELAVHLMRNSAVTGATYDIDGGQQLT